MKKVIKILKILACLLVFVIVWGVFYFYPDKDKVLNFISDNPEKSSIKLILNDTILVEMNPNKQMILASTAKIITAIEYAEQAAKGLINPLELVDLAELEKYYVPKSDGGGHNNWLESIDKNIKKNSVSIKEVARGMMKFSSNANTEWLGEKLGLVNINNRLDSLGVEKHSEISYKVSPLFIGVEEFPHLDKRERAIAVQNLSNEEYIQATNKVHQKLKSNKEYPKDVGLLNLALYLQKNWSDNLPSSTVHEYVEIMKKINSRKYFNSDVQQYLEEILDNNWGSEFNENWVSYSGMKQGATSYVLTKALYVTDKKGNKTELAYFFNDINLLQVTRLQGCMKEFETSIISNKSFREKINLNLGNQ